MNYSNHIFHVFLVLFFSLSEILTAQPVAPKNRDALYAGEQISLENEHIKMVFFKRQSGVHRTHWNGYSWAELYGPDKTGNLTKFLGVLEHFGEVDLEGHCHPLRMDAIEHNLESTLQGQKLTFELNMAIPEEGCMAWGNMIAVKGQAVFFLPTNGKGIHYELFLKSDFRTYYRSIRGPWLRIGAYDFGAKKKDAIFSGIEWLVENEWSSSIDFMAPSKALRVTPHPRKVTAPVMAVSHNDLVVSLTWDPDLKNIDVTSRLRYPQPVFACPNFIDKRDENLMGLMFPAAGAGMEENKLSTDNKPIFPYAGVKFKARIGVHKGSSLDAVVDWVKREDMPDPGEQRYATEDLVERVAEAYNTHFWAEDSGWTYHKTRDKLLFHGTAWYLSLGVDGSIRNKPSWYVPEFVEYYLENGKDEKLKMGLSEKVKWCRKQGDKYDHDFRSRKINGFPEMFEWYSKDELRKFGEEILDWQSETGAFYYEPSDRHSTEHETMARAYRPLGQPGDSLMDFNMTTSILLLTLGEALDEARFIDAARKALENAMPYERPEGGDWWETTIYSPNYYSAGWGALAYFLGYQVFGDERYKKKAVHYIRSLLPFTYLWNNDIFPMMYHTKPLFGATGWRYMAWTDRCVHWHVISLINISQQLKINWLDIDPELNWHKYQKGAIYAGLRLLADHTDPDWIAHSEDINEEFLEGKMDMFVADTFDPVDFMYGGLVVRIAPNALMMSLLHISE